ncbi:MAG: hypothetical protein ACN4EP_12145 [Sediminibacterium sp.]
MKTKQLLIIFLLIITACKKSVSPGSSNTDPAGPGNQPTTTASNNGSTSLNIQANVADWIGEYNNQFYAVPVMSHGGELLRYNATDRKVNMIRKFGTTDRFQVKAHSIDAQGNIYMYAQCDVTNGDVGVMKLDADGNVLWKKKYKMQISPFVSFEDMQPRAIKLINGYLWALSSFFLLKIDPANGNVLATTGIGNTSNRWAPGEDIIRAGQNIMVQMGGGQLYFYVLKTTDLSIVKSVKTAFTFNPTSGYPTNTILDVSDNRFFAVTHYRQQSSLFPRGVIIEFDADGKILNSAVMEDQLSLFEVTRMHRDKDGNYTVAYNTHLQLSPELKTKDVLVFNKNLELTNKVSLMPSITSSAISFNVNTTALIHSVNGKTTIEWVDIKNPGCKTVNMPSNIKLQSLSFKSPVVTTNVPPFVTQMKYIGTENMAYTVENINYTQTVNKCN